MIVFVHSSLEIGGAEVLRKFVAQELHNRGIDFRVCLIEGGGQIAEELLDAGFTVDTLSSSRSIYNPRTTFALIRYLKHHQPLVVQSSQFNSNFHARIAAKIAGVPCVICEEHGIYRWKDWWHRLSDRYLARWCDKIIAVSQAVKDFNVNEIGVPAGKLKVLHNCLDTDISKFTHSRDYVRTELGIGRNEFVIGHVGTLRTEKGHDVLLEAFKLFCTNKPAKLLLVGDGPLKGLLKQQVESLGLCNKVIFAGTRSDVPDLLRSMDLFVFPSRNEALGIALLEAMFSGLPIIAARTGGIPEIISDGVTGLLVDNENVNGFADSMLCLSHSSEMCRTMGRAAQQYVIQHHSPQAYVDQLSSVYNQILSQKGLL